MWLFQTGKMVEQEIPIELDGGEPGQLYYRREAVLNRRWNRKNRTYEYLLKWAFWSDEWNSWEEEHRLKVSK